MRWEQVVHDLTTPIGINAQLSLLAAVATYHFIPAIAPLFLQAGFAGADMAKRARPTIPESMGVIAGATYLIAMFLFIPFLFQTWIDTPIATSSALHLIPPSANRSPFPHEKLEIYLGGLLSLTCMVLLGFADDALNLKWRHKLWLPLIASIPILVVYYVNYGVTTIILPRVLRRWLAVSSIDLGVLYYVYMACLSIFCTNAINILAGINGVEVGQTIVIVFAILCNNILWMQSETVDLASAEVHTFSFYLMLPLLGVMLALFVHNRYPATVFVGDSFCYFAGMTIAVTAILSHTSKTVLLFFIPQIFNFLYSCPQLFGLVPCPRHRMPTYNEKTDRLSTSKVALSKPLSQRFLPVWQMLSSIGIVSFEEQADGAGASESELTPRKQKGRRASASPKRVKSPKKLVFINNLTLLNFILHHTGPLHESTLCWVTMGVQAVCCIIGFLIRYKFVHFVY